MSDYGTCVNVGANDIEVKAYGGTRRQRGSKITAALRSLREAGRVGELICATYDEAYGFMEMTTARYRVQTPAQSAEADRRERAEAGVYCSQHGSNSTCGPICAARYRR